MDLGAFSISLPVTDLARSREFYATLGFTPTGGTIIGLFAFDGMDFDAPMLTFNPGLTQDMGTTAEFTDVRDVAAALDGAGVEPVARPEPGTGPAHLVVLDPDGHRILVDQFVDAPGSGS